MSANMLLHDCGQAKAGHREDNDHDWIERGFLCSGA